MQIGLKINKNKTQQLNNKIEHRKIIQRSGYQETQGKREE